MPRTLLPVHVEMKQVFNLVSLLFHMYKYLDKVGPQDKSWSHHLDTTTCEREVEIHLERKEVLGAKANASAQHFYAQDISTSRMTW